MTRTSEIGSCKQKKNAKTRFVHQYCARRLYKHYEALYKFSLVTMLTLEGFGRPSETNFCYTLKVIWYMRKNMKLDIAINNVCSWLFFMSVH